MPQQDERTQGRAKVEAQRRRRRGDEGLAADKRMPIPPEVKARLDAEGLVPRWVNDDRNRMHRFTVLDDWDKVEGVEPVPVGTAEDGKPILAHLLAKPRKFVREDQRNAEKRRAQVEQALTRNADDSVRPGKNPNPGTARRYVAPETNISRGNQVLDS